MPKISVLVLEKLQTIEAGQRLIISLLKTKQTPPTPENKYLTIAEAATYLRMSKSSLYKHTMNHTIKFYKNKKRLYFLIEELDEFINRTPKA